MGRGAGAGESEGLARRFPLAHPASYADAPRAETLRLLNETRVALGLPALNDLPAGERALLYGSATPIANAFADLGDGVRVAVIGSRLEVTAPLADYDAAVERVEKIAAALGVELRRGPYGAPMGSYGQATVSHNIPLPAPITAFLDQHRRGSYTDLLPFDPARPFDPAQPLKMVITGKMASGKGAASGHLVERYGAKRMPREDIIKPFVYGIAEGDPATPERLAELFPDDQSVRSGLEQEIGRYMKSYVDEGGKRRRLLQDVIDFVQQRNAYAIEEALNRRIAAAAADAPFVIIDDVRPLEAFDYFKGQGYITVRIEASRRIREQRMLERDGVIPPDEAFQHWTETALDGVPHDFVIYNETNDPEALTCKLDAVLERITLRQQAAA